MKSSVIKDALDKCPYLNIPKALADELSAKLELPYINGCGVDSGIMVNFNMRLVDIVDVTPACIIHDFRYFVGATLDDKIRSDMELLSNIILILEHAPDVLTIDTWKRQARIDEAVCFFRAVNEYGLKAFTADKNSMKQPDVSLFTIMKQSVQISMYSFFMPIKMISEAFATRARIASALAGQQ